MPETYNIVRTALFEAEIIYQTTTGHPSGAGALRRLAKLVGAQIDEDRIKAGISLHFHRQHGGYDTDDISKCKICNRSVIKDTSTALPVEPPTRGRMRLFKT